MAVESRLFAVHDPFGEVVRLEKAPDTVQSTPVFLGVFFSELLQSSQSQESPEIALVQADAVGQPHLISAPIRSVAKTKYQDSEPNSQIVVQQTRGSERTLRKPDLFLDQRISAVLPRVRGCLLDVGCGTNELVRRHGNGEGVDRLHHGWKPGKKFDTVTLMAVLNYVPEEDRKYLLEECHERLNKFGRMIVTCISPLGSFIHRLVRPKQPRGLSRDLVQSICESYGFKLVYSRPFMLGLNRVYVFSKEELPCMSA